MKLRVRCLRGIRLGRDGDIEMCRCMLNGSVLSGRVEIYSAHWERRRPAKQRKAKKTMYSVGGGEGVERPVKGRKTRKNLEKGKQIMTKSWLGNFICSSSSWAVVCYHKGSSHASFSSRFQTKKKKKAPCLRVKTDFLSSKVIYIHLFSLTLLCKGQTVKQTTIFCLVCREKKTGKQCSLGTFLIEKELNKYWNVGNINNSKHKITSFLKGT